MENKSNNARTFIGDIAKDLNATRDGSSSEYATYEAVNGKVFTLRLSNNNATVSIFDNRGEAEGLSIIISAKPNARMMKDGDAHVSEYMNLH